MHPELLDAEHRLLHEVKFRTERPGITTVERVRVGDEPSQAILRELRRVRYDLLVMGAIERHGSSGLLPGKHTQAVVTQAKIPVVLLVSHTVTNAAA